MRLLFVHGAGGYDEDGPLADDLAGELDAGLTMPRLPDEDMSHPAWAEPVAAAVAGLGPGDVVIGHSFGASILLRVLLEQPTPAATALLAMPDWGPQGWGVADYDYPAGPAAAELVTVLHHCRDDEVAPFAHLDRHRARLPQSRAVAHDTGGHQLVGLAAVIADSLAGRSGG